MIFNEKLLKKLFKKEQIRFLKKSLKENNEIPTNVMYQGIQWDRIANDSEYTLQEREIFALNKGLSKLAKYIGNNKVNLIQLGVGNGLEIPFIIEKLGLMNINKYAIVDINPYMIKLTKKNTKQKYPSLELNEFITDIEVYGIKKICEKIKIKKNEINIIFLIGNGVLFANKSLVKEIYNSLEKTDYFFITLEMYKKNKKQEIIKPYLIPSVLELLKNSIKLIGYNAKYNEFNVKIDPKTSLLKITYSPENTLEEYLVLKSFKPETKKNLIITHKT